MTREEASEMIRDDIKKHHDYLSGNYRKALNMAIKALEQESCEDAVSREVIMQHYDSGEYKHVNHISRNGLLDYIEQLPSAQPEDCDTCKHGYFGDSHCDNCRVRYPSHYERRTDG